MRDLTVPAARGAVIVALAAVLAACDAAGTAPTAGLDTSITIAAGDSVRLTGTSLRLTFVGVEGDSRCPADAICIQGGDALVRFRVDDDGLVRTLDLHTGRSEAVRLSGFTFRLEQLVPYPFSSRTIGPDEYRATIRVTR